MNKSFFISFFAVGLVLLLPSCEKQDNQPEAPMKFEAWTPTKDNDTKVYFDASHMVYWTEDDQISVFRSSTNEQYEFDGATGDDYGTFTKIDASVKSTSYSKNYALYPYSNTANCTDAGLMSFTFPATQLYALKSPGLGASAMVAATSNSDDNQFRFRNLCGYLILKITGDINIREISITGNNNEVLSGAATAQIVYLNAPTVTVIPAGGKTVTLNCAPGVALNKTTPVEFWFAIPETTFTTGFTINVTTTSEGWFSKSTSKNISIERNTITPMATFNISKTEIDNQLELPAVGGEVAW